ncbi:MAG: glutamate formimidoyltransferase [Candidatus Thermoplasmatota archaeon]|nr:glutamate formimidoyltransferase [Candidatus Thermoplasmatota archaeon]
MTALVECVPNFSEGRNLEVVELIVNSARGIDGCAVLSAEPDSDYNRTVVTLAGEPEAVSEAAFRLISAASVHIDMRNHQGEHPRLGAVDVCPFIPLRNSSYSECAELAHSLGQRVSSELGLPVYYYGDAATHTDRTVLSTLRKGEYEGLKARLSNGDTIHNDITKLPDEGPNEWNDLVSRFGAIVIGSRPILVAYNVNLSEKDAKVAKMCGTIVRSSGRLIKSGDKRMRVSGMLQKVQGMGLPLESHGISQVSMNLQDVSITDMHDAYECIRSLSSDHGVDVCGSELVGLAPLSSFLNAGRWYHDNPDNATEEELVEAAVQGLGLDSLGPFVPAERIIEYAAELMT